jgi:hypothetical protein
MCPNRLRPELFGPILLIALSSGCRSLDLYRDRPLPIEVRDAESGQPIAGAQVEFSHPILQAWQTSGPVVGVTRSDGIARISSDGIARLLNPPIGYVEDTLYIEVKVKDYQPYATLLSKESIEQIKAFGVFESANQRPAEVVMWLYADPQFKVELVVPRGYRGPVRATIQIQDELVCPLGQRVFSYRVESGSVRVIGPTALRRVRPAMFVGKYEDGNIINSDGADKSTVVLRWLKQEDDYELFYVGDASEIDKYRQQIYIGVECLAPRSTEPAAGGSSFSLPRIKIK